MQEGRCITPNWYYGNALRTSDVQLVFSLLFHFTDDWHAVRVISGIITYVAMLLSILFFCKMANFMKAFPYIGTFLLLPFSEIYFFLILMAPHYIFHVTIAFFTLGMAFWFIRAPKRATRVVILLAGAILALLAGLDGLRRVLNIYIPLVGASVVLFLLEHWNKHPKEIAAGDTWKRALHFSICSFFFSAIGYLINSKVLSRYYTFADFGGIRWQPISAEQVVKMLNDWLIAFGYHRFAAVFSVGTVFNITCLLSVFTVLIYGIIILIRRKQFSPQLQLVTCFFFVAAACYNALYFFTDAVTSTSYSIPILVFAIPLVIVCLQQRMTKSFWRRMLSVGLSCMIVACSLATYRKWIKTDETAELRDIVRILEEHDSMDGYATFWNANVMTELSNGKIEVRNLGEPAALKDVINVHHNTHLLELKSHDKTVPQGHTFCLIGADERKYSIAKSMRKENVLYASDAYTLYGFDSFADMARQMSDYRFVFGTNEWLSNGQDHNGIRELFGSGSSFGPLMSMFRGKYHVEITGENLSAVSVDCIWHDDAGAEQPLELLNYSGSDSAISYDVVVDADIICQVETRVFNRGDDPVKITGIDICMVN